jgi:hypothetical protein
MLANFFDKTKPFNSIVLGLVFLAFFFTHVYLIKSSEFTDFSWLKATAFFFFHLLFLILSNSIFIKNEVSNNNLHNTFIIILLYCMFPNAFDTSNLLFVSILFLLIYKNLAQLTTKGTKQLSLLDSGIFTGISFLLFDWSILFLGFIYIGIFLAQKLHFKNIISPILGFLVPVFLYFTYCFVTDNTALFIEKFDFNYSISYESYSKPYLQIPLIAFITIVTLSLFSLLPKLLSTSGPYRYQYTLAILMLLTGCIAITLDPTKNGSEFILIFIPASILIGRFLKMITNLVLKEVFLIAFTIFSIVILIQGS